jgi:hypothetical protein
MFELWTHDSITGNERGRVFPAEAGAQWSTNIGGTGTCSFRFVVNDAETGMGTGAIATTFQTNARMFSLREGSEVMGAWKIEDWDYDQDAGIVTVTGVELRNEAAWRMTYGVSGYTSGTLAVAARSYPGAVRAILARFMQWSADWAYPIDLPPDGAGPFSATWEFWKKFTIEDLLKQIEDEGYEVFLRPYLSGTQLRFDTMVAPRVQTFMSYFHLQAEDSPLGGVHLKVSGSGQITGGQGVGNGTGQDQATAWAGGGPFLIPIRDAKKEFPDLEGARLQAATDAWFASVRNPTVQWTVGKFTVSDQYPAAHAATGRGWQLESKGHPVFVDGVHPVRVIASSGSFSNVITTEVQYGS